MDNFFERIFHSHIKIKKKKLQYKGLIATLSCNLDIDITKCKRGKQQGSTKNE